MNTIHLSIISKDLNLPQSKVQSTINLLEEGATIPFIARYRKEATGSLDEVNIGDIKTQLEKLKEIEKRKDTILKSIEGQGKLTDNLKRRIQDTFDSTVLEDIYLPYKQKRKTRASVAKEKGLEPLADVLFSQNNHSVEELAEQYLTDEVNSIDDALQGARDIMAEWINEDQVARQKVRFAFERDAQLSAKLVRGKEEEAHKYKDYFKFEQPLHNCPSHRLLAIRRAEDEGFLRVNIAPDAEEVLYRLEREFLENGNGAATNQVNLAMEDAYKRLLQPSIETEFRNMSKELADAEAINVFTGNLKQLLLSPPLGQKRVLAIDPGFRTGCKVVCLDESGELLKYSTIFPHPPQSKEYEAIADVKYLVDKYQIDAIAIGNGTAGRESLTIFQQVDYGRPVEVFMVNENGASIYSASEIAREEFPDQDITVRGSVSIGRRLMDPLAELVKIDPKSIGVGQYQHDVNQTKLKESLDRTVESCVNNVGINLNTASKPLLTYVSGLGPTLAKNIIEYRTENGLFKSRSELKKVKRMGDKAFEQAAGFLRIRDAKNPLDNTAVHPESYSVVKQMAKDLNCSVEELIKSESLRKQIDLKKYVTENIGLPTLTDIFKELEKPGLDPRGSAKAVEFSKTIKTIDDVNPGMILTGVINNITNFGAFVDIGIKQGGLVHISEIANRFIKNPAEVVSLNQEVKVKVLEVDLKRGRIQLSMKQV
ncbi:MAG: Tex family protein [Saprospiraceae bacterium]|nr:Tex family protein [Saprospiraceae bacterium]